METKSRKNKKNKTRKHTKTQSKKSPKMPKFHNINAERITPRYSGISALYKSIYGPRRPSALFY
jgi:hypothetical protein